MVELKNKPLVEAIFELRWELQEPSSGVKIDPHYKILIGRVYDRIHEEYPFHEQLPTATIPDEMAEYVAQHRFRKDKDKWPLIQIGPGIITVNDTEGYVWKDFEKRIVGIIKTLFEVYPDSKNNLKVNRLMLRYIDAIAFDFEKGDAFAFLKEKVKTNINLHQKLFKDTGVEKLPLGFDLRFSFASTKPKGAMNMRFIRGKRKGADAIIWETMIRTISKDVPNAASKIADWVKEAHELVDDWFLKLIEGELFRRFK